MPNCIIKDCKYYYGRRLNESDDVTLHVFPKNLETIKKWLESIQKSGQDFGDIDEFAQRIYNSKRSDIFRICSQHFEDKCYTFQLVRKKFMKKESIPTIFKTEQKTPEPPLKKVRGDPSPIKELDAAERESGVYPLFMYQSVIGEPHSATLHAAPVCGNHKTTTNPTGLVAEASSPSTSQSNDAMPKIISCTSLQETTNTLPQAVAQSAPLPVPMFHAFPSFADAAVNTDNSIKKDASTDTSKLNNITNASHTNSNSTQDKSVQVPET